MVGDNITALEADLDELAEIRRLAGHALTWNIFEATGRVWREDRHSDTLAFLLSPNQHHGLVDIFASQLLAAAGVVLPAGRCQHLVVAREWGRQWNGWVPRTDLLLTDDLQRLAVIIENKTGSAERPGQLDAYWQMVHYYFPGWAIAGIYLTPDGRAPAEPADRARYAPMSYASVCTILEQIADSRNQTLDSDTLTLLNHYTQMLRRHIMDIPAELVERCQAFYRKHQQALDIIYQYRPDHRAETRELITTLIDETPELQLVYSRPDGGEICFVIVHWMESNVLISGSWPHSNAMLLFEIDNYPDVPSLTLRLYIAPGPEDTRQQLEKLADANLEIFSTRRNAHDDWIIVYEYSLLDTAAHQQLVGVQRNTCIRAAWESFRQQMLPAIQTLISQQEWIWVGKGISD